MITVTLMNKKKRVLGVFKNMGGNFPGENFLGGNFPRRGIYQRGV